MRVLSNFYYVTNIFDLHIFENEKAALSYFFFNLHGFAFWLFFLNERNITTSLLMKNLKCTVVHYTNLNWSSKNKPFLNYGCAEYAISLFFLFAIYVYVYFNEAFVKIFVTIIFNTNFQNAFITQSLLLISNIVTGAGQFLATESPWKIMKIIFISS